MICSTEKNVLLYSKKLNRIKLQKQKFGELLKLRYKFERSIDYYEKYISDKVPFEFAATKIEKLFNHKTQLYSKDYQNLTVGSLKANNVLLSYVNSLQQEFSNKTAIIESLADYRASVQNKRFTIAGIVLSIIATCISAITLYFTPIPSDSISFPEFLFSIFSKLF